MPLTQKKHEMKWMWLWQILFTTILSHNGMWGSSCASPHSQTLHLTNIRCSHLPLLPYLPKRSTNSMDFNLFYAGSKTIGMKQLLWKQYNCIYAGETVGYKRKLPSTLMINFICAKHWVEWWDLRLSRNRPHSFDLQVKTVFIY
jgi:hypothetical protein